MSRVKLVNPNASVIGKRNACNVNVSAAKALADLLKTNLGPKGTLKMLVGGAGQIKLTKDGKVLLDDMQIQHPTALLLARSATASDDITGDGTTSNVLFAGALMKAAERYLVDGLHPRVLVEGFEAARDETLKFLDTYKVEAKNPDKELLTAVARTSLRTKVHRELADHLTAIVVEAVQCVQRPDAPIDLHMVEIQHMRHKADMDTCFVDGLVLDHGARHPGMKPRCENAFILTLNLSLEYEKSMVNASFLYKNSEEREAMVKAERKHTDDKVLAVIALKEKVCAGNDNDFVIVNQKGIDPISLDLLQKAGIVALRRSKKRNAERIPRACGGYSVDSVDGLTPEALGFAKSVYEHVLGDDKFTFIEQCKEANSCTILIRGPNDHSIRQIKDAIRDGLRAVTNVIEDESVVPGAGAFEVAAHVHLTKFKSSIAGRAKLGVQAFADALLVIPRTLASNAGLDATDALLLLIEDTEAGQVVGIDLATGECLEPAKAGIWDNHRVKRQLIHLGSLVAEKLLLVDEIIRGGKQFKKQ